jgi:hypothetical protein
MVRNTNSFRSRRWLEFLLVLGGLNLLWEAAHLPFYTLWKDGSWPVIAYDVVHCTMGDVLIAASCSLVALAPLRWRWPEGWRQSSVFLTIFLVCGAGYTIYSEWLNVVVRKSWAYSDLMPVLPPFGTGLTPLLQWLLMPLLSFWLISRT